MAQLTLAQRLALVENTLPQDYDPEDLHGGTLNEKSNVADQEEEEEAHDADAGREHYVEVGPSSLRRLNENLNDPKYDGMKISRSQLLNDENEDEDDDADDRSDNLGNDPPSTHGGSGSSEEEDEKDDEDEEDEKLSTKGQRKHLRSESASGDKAMESLDTTLQQTRLADKLKGQAVSRQLRIWDALVDSRIQLQKTVSATNKLPPPPIVLNYLDVPEAQKSVRQYFSQAYLLSEELFQLRRALLKHAGSDPPPQKRQRTSLELEGDNVDFQTLFKESIEEMMDFEAQIHESNLFSLQKWSAKVQAVAPSALLPMSKISFKGGPARMKSAGELVDEAMKDSEKLLKNTRGRFNRIGSIQREEAENDDDGGGDEETFDDREFYQSMLRDVIESKGGKEAITDLYANSKKQRKKKNVDTKASKGRKLRYEPHEKILNFMVPIPAKGAWHEEQIDELFASLLGKGFEDNFKPNGNGADMAMVPEQSTLQGFRIFG